MLLFLSTGRDYFPSLWFWVGLYCLWPIAQLPNLGLKRIGRLLFLISWNAPLLRTQTPCFKEIQKKAMWRKEDKKALLPVELADNRQPWRDCGHFGPATRDCGNFEHSSQHHAKQKMHQSMKDLCLLRSKLPFTLFHLSINKKTILYLLKLFHPCVKFS